jgi:hypothetical protein
MRKFDYYAAFKNDPVLIDKLSNQGVSRLGKCLAEQKQMFATMTSVQNYDVTRICSKLNQTNCTLSRQWLVDPLQIGRCPVLCETYVP